MGSSMHSFLEMVYKGLSVHWIQRDLDRMSEDNRIKMWCMMNGYASYWLENDNKILVPDAVELDFNMALRHHDTNEIIPNARMHGKIDMVATKSNGGVWIMEHKTTSERIEKGSTYWSTVKMSPQAALYWLAAKEQGWNVEELIYNVIRTPQQRRKKNQSAEEYMDAIVTDMIDKPDSYFARQSFTYTEEEEAQFQQDLVETWELMEYGKERGIAPRYTSNCKWGFWLCEFDPICSGKASKEDPRFRESSYSKAENRDFSNVRGHLKVVR